jgi:hypothetical protein
VDKKNLPEVERFSKSFAILALLRCTPKITISYDFTTLQEKYQAIGIVTLISRLI